MHTFIALQIGHRLNKNGFERLADALQAAVFALYRPDYKHELLSVPLCTQLVRKLPTMEKDE